MPNRKERRAERSKAYRALRERAEKAGRLVVGGRLSPEEKERIKRVTQLPGYHEMLDRLYAAALEWRELYPEAELTFTDTRGILLTAHLKDEFNKGYLAVSRGAKDLLIFMDERTGHEATLMQVQFVLGALGWIER